MYSHLRVYALKKTKISFIIEHRAQEVNNVMYGDIVSCIEGISSIKNLDSI